MAMETEFPARQAGLGKPPGRCPCSIVVNRSIASVISTSPLPEIHVHRSVVRKRGCESPVANRGKTLHNFSERRSTNRFTIREKQSVLVATEGPRPQLESASPQRNNSMRKNLFLLLVTAACLTVAYLNVKRATTEPELTVEEDVPPKNPIAHMMTGTERSPEYWRALAELPFEEWTHETGTFLITVDGKEVLLGTVHLSDKVTELINEDHSDFGGPPMSAGPIVRAKHWHSLSADRKLVIAKSAAHGRPPGDSVERWMTDLDRAAEDLTSNAWSIVVQVEWMREAEREAAEADAI